MEGLGWTIDRTAGLVTVRGMGVFDLPFAMSFQEMVRAGGMVRYCKLFDLRLADIRLSNDDLQAMVASTRLFSATTAGPIAVVVGRNPPPLLVDMAVLLKNRIGRRRRLHLFIDEAEARQWLASEEALARLSRELSRRPHLGVASFARVS